MENKKVRIGILGPADIAKRKMIPAINLCEALEYVGIAVSLMSERADGINADGSDTVIEKSLEKAKAITSEYGGVIFRGYEKMLKSNDIEAIYIALPPALHYRWAKKALEYGKHVLLEKPFTTNSADASELIKIAREKELAIAENFAFAYHSQLAKIIQIISDGDLGELRLIRSNFGFPFRGKDDFRYQNALGGGALLDCGCYTIKLANLLTDGDITILNSSMYKKRGFDVDIYGMINAVGRGNVPIQLSYGMDQQYSCELEIWGSKGCLRSNRIFTAPADYAVELSLAIGNDKKTITVEPDDQFKNSAVEFCKMISNDDLRLSSYDSILEQNDMLVRCMDGALWHE